MSYTILLELRSHTKPNQRRNTQENTRRLKARHKKQIPTLSPPLAARHQKGHRVTLRLQVMGGGRARTSHLYIFIVGRKLLGIGVGPVAILMNPVLLFSDLTLRPTSNYCSHLTHELLVARPGMLLRHMSHVLTMRLHAEKLLHLALKLLCPRRFCTRGAKVLLMIISSSPTLGPHGSSSSS